ncbi:trigger factor [Gimesia fumaroli]|uniref:Trigger factor n=1 Tax=Gimesia fumaroli TaxID=2527976 RepID=A0A518IEZ0_9PLAN|nr:trigger factor [Gimesia fumaroli]QDV51659.1 Trigger factor [Gimesia fumaroli]
MSDELATTDATAEETVSADSEYKMSVTAKIDEVGPCKKHVTVTVPRTDIDHFYSESVSELGGQATVPGFRVGHVPKKLIEKRFRQELTDQVKQRVLMESLELIAEDNDLDPINEPTIDVESLEIPDEGEFQFEFEVEVRPDFKLPEYKGLKLERPVREIGDKDVDEYLNRFLNQYGEMEERKGAAETEDYLEVSIKFEHGGKPLSEINDLVVPLRPVLRLQDAEIKNFGELMAGVKTDDTRETELEVSEEAEQVEMRGEKVKATFTVKSVKFIQVPEINEELLERIGAESEEELREEVKNILERQVTYEQRQTTRSQVLDKITESADWDLPESLVTKQVENALRREILEMQQAGFSRQDIQARENELRQQAISSTRKALKEHFVLDKIASTENLEVQPQEIDMEIYYMAMQQGESPRRVRARMVKSGMIENLEAQLRERKAVDVILEKAEYTEKEMEKPEENQVSAIARSVCSTFAATAGEEEEAEADKE